MSYAIICNAMQGRKLGIENLALVDRKKTRRLWWTSDDVSIIMRFRKRSAAEFSLRRLHYKKPQIVSYKEACRIINRQDQDIMHHEAEADCCLGWDDHKDC